MKKTILSILFLAQTLIIAGCIDLTQIQKGYVFDRDECISHGQQSVSTYLPECPPETPNCSKDKANLKHEDFCECMRERGWSPARSLLPPYHECPKTPPTTVTPRVM